MSKQQQSFLVIADTNTLFPKDPKQIVSGGFITTLDECLKFAKLRFLLPEVVRGERLYQMFSVACRSRENAEKNIETITGVCASGKVPLPDTIEIREAVERRFDEWARSRGAEIVGVPYDKVNWRRVVNDAIWRVSPFTPSTEGKDTEKGFRDCLIVETLDDVIRSATGEQVVFITRDRLLRGSTIARFGPKAFAAYEDLDGFLSYLKLTHEQAEKARDAMVQAILQKAPGVFFTPDDPRCVYAQFNLGSHIIQKFSAQLNASPPSRFENNEDATGGETFSPASGEKIFIDTTQYEKSNETSVWGWKTRLRFVRMFRPQALEKTGMCAPDQHILTKLIEAFALNEIIRIAPFDVHWTAQCSREAKFSQLKLIRVEAQPQTKEVGFFKFKYGFEVKEPT